MADKKGRDLTEGDVRNFERCYTLKMLSSFEKSFLDDFSARFKLYGYKTNIFPKQEAILKTLVGRLPKEAR